MTLFRNPGSRRLRPPVLTLVAVSLAALFLLSVVTVAAQPEEPINVNTASAEELTELPRIGEVIAARIVAWREENGPFAEIEELLNVQGIGERTFERIRPHVTVEASGEPRQGRGGCAGRTDLAVRG